ncbi:MAG: ROK family transcriptional regulator [Acidimicrobiales bacterium]|jgi:predicted NBD/HSP70 family sugar kinase
MRILRALHENRIASRTQLERFTGLSRATVAALTADLISAGIVEETGATGDEIGVRRTGRPAQLLSIQPSAAYAVGVDIGHQQTRVMLCDASGATRWDHIVPQDVDYMPEQTLETACEMVQVALKSVGPARQRVLGIGVGIASPVDARTGALSSSSIMAEWHDIQPAYELSHRTGLSTQLINDANAGALAEHLYGAARNCANAVYVRLSAGIGAGILTKGQLLVGAHGLAGELGHVEVAPGGRICRCGNRGCLETVASPVAIAQLLSNSWGHTVTTEDLFRLLESGNDGARRAVSDAGDAVGRCVGAMVTLLDPELIVVGGELAAAGAPLLEAIRHSIRHYRMPSRSPDIRVVPGKLGDSAAVRGAAGIILASAPESLGQPTLAAISP